MARRHLTDIPWSFVLLTSATGMVDAISFLGLGHVFVANMTGNVAFLGFAAAGYRGVSAPGALVALFAFLFGALLAGRLILRVAEQSAHLLLLKAIVIRAILAVGALSMVATNTVHSGAPSAYVLIAILAVGMGLQNGVTRKIAVPDFTTTVLTRTITGIAADLGEGSDPKILRRSTSVVSMFSGALLGGFLVLRSGVTYALIAICFIFALTALVMRLTARARQTADAPTD